jgi:recombination protein RecT
MGEQLRMALPSHVSVDKFQRVTMTAIQSTPALLDADRRSLFGAIVKAAQDGLLPDGREGALVIFKGKHGAQVQWMPMVAGILKKVRQSGELASIDAQLVHEADRFTYRPGIDEVPIHEPDWFGERGKVVGAYAVARLKTGAACVEIMSRQQIEQVRSVSRARDNGPWLAWWGEMARKTVVRRLAKRLPMSTDIEAEFERDETMQADAAAMLIASPQQPAPQSRLDALEQYIAGGAEDTDEGAQPHDDDFPGDLPFAVEEPAEDIGEGFDMGEPESVVLAASIERKLKMSTAATLEANWIELAGDLRRLKAMDSDSYGFLVALKDRMKRDFAAASVDADRE